MRQSEWRDYVWWYGPVLSWALVVATGVALALALAAATFHWHLWYVRPIIVLGLVALAFERPWKGNAR